MFNNQEIDLVERSGCANITGNNNRITVKRSHMQINITGNNNKVDMSNSPQVVLALIGNNNLVRCGNARVTMSVIGNNNELKSEGSRVEYTNVMGNNNHLQGYNDSRQVWMQQPRQTRDMHRRPPRSQRREQSTQANQQAHFQRYGLPFLLSAMSQMQGALNGISANNGMNMHQQNRPRMRERQHRERQRQHSINQLREQFRQMRQPHHRHPPSHHHHRDHHVIILDDDEQESEPEQGMRPNELNQLPKSKNKGQKRNCSVCMEDIKTDEYETFLICFHSFHSECIERWFVKKHQCPVCQTDIKKGLAQLTREIAYN